MKKIIVFFAALVACLFLLNTNLFSRQMATRPNPEAVDLRPDEFRKSTPLLVEEKVAQVVVPTEEPKGYPVFDFGSIRFKSAGLGKCVGVTLVPQLGKKVEVRSQRFTKSFWGAAAKPGKVLSKWTKVGPGGMRVKYDRAGGSQDYYKVFCRVRDNQGARIVDCRDALMIQDVKTGHCFSGPGSTDADYAPLSMTIRNK